MEDERERAILVGQLDAFLKQFVDSHSSPVLADEVGIFKEIFEIVLTDLKNGDVRPMVRFFHMVELKIKDLHNELAQDEASTSGMTEEEVFNYYATKIEEGIKEPEDDNLPDSFFMLFTQSDIDDWAKILKDFSLLKPRIVN